jgi:predicted transcriptional regulator
MSTEENWRPKLQYLQTRFELDDNALKHLVLNAYSLVGLSEDTIEEKLQFYSNLIGEREAKRLVVKTYNLLKQSLKRRLNPRLAEVEKSGVKVRWNETLIKRLAIRSKEQWEKYKLDDAPRGRAAS